MTDVSKAFAPVRAKLYKAILGTDVSTIDGASSLPVALEDMGSLSLSAGFSITPAGEPSRVVEREFYDDKVFFVTKSPSDTLPTFDITANESNLLVLETAFGATVDSDGLIKYAGGIPENAVYVLDLADAAASPKTMRYLMPNAGASINGSVSGSGDAKLVKWPLRFTPEPSEDIDGDMFWSWASWLADAS
jgi:hypothetical protein